MIDWIADLKQRLKSGDPAFLKGLSQASAETRTFTEALGLHNLRKRAIAAGKLTTYARGIRLAMIGGCTLRPLADLAEHFVSVLLETKVELWTGEFDNYKAEVWDEASDLYKFKPEIVFLIPSAKQVAYPGSLSDSTKIVQEFAHSHVQELLKLTSLVRQRAGCDVVLANYPLPGSFDPGPLRYTYLGSEYALKKYVNLHLGMNLSPHTHLCDVEFLCNRRGTIAATDPRGWFESKQPFAADMLIDIAKELARTISQIKQPPKKVLVLDLDNTLWGGVIGDDGLTGIELGTTSARGEAFREFQRYVLSLAERGVVLAVCSKNDLSVAKQPFEQHPEMLLKLKDIASFKANWNPKSDNLQEISRDLNLGMDALVFVDDNPAEIEIVRQLVPDVSAICLGDDPSQFISRLSEARFFERRTLTAEDAARSSAYRQEAERKVGLASATDYSAYLASLQMEAEVADFVALDVPRIAQLVNKSNQFNLTTRRRSEADVLALMSQREYRGFTLRLRDKFGDHGLISVIILKRRGRDVEIDTWLMSCRVLKRQVEELALEEILRLSREWGSNRVLGTYFPTAKNGMVADLYRTLGFSERADEPGDSKTYEISNEIGVDRDIKIRIIRRNSETA